MNLLTMPNLPSIATSRDGLREVFAGKDYWRMTVVFVNCPACGAYRGEPCRGNSFRPWMGGIHSDRRLKAAARRKRHPKSWEKLKVQIYQQAEKEKAQ